MTQKNIPFFQAVQPKQFNWPVRVPVPGEGKYLFVEFTGVFKYLDDAGEKALLADTTKPTDPDKLRAVLLAVEGLKYEDGTEVPSSPELIEQMLATDRVAPVTMGTYLAARRGLAAEKNS